MGTFTLSLPEYDQENKIIFILRYLWGKENSGKKEKFPYEAIFQWWPIEKIAIGITDRNPNSEKGYDTRTLVVVAEYNTKLVVIFPA